MTHVTCRLTAKNRDQLQNSTLGSRVWATSTFLLLRYCCYAGGGEGCRQVADVVLVLDQSTSIVTGDYENWYVVPSL